MDLKGFLVELFVLNDTFGDVWHGDIDDLMLKHGLLEERPIMGSDRDWEGDYKVGEIAACPSRELLEFVGHDGAERLAKWHVAILHDEDVERG